MALFKFKKPKELKKEKGQATAAEEVAEPQPKKEDKATEQKVKPSTSYKSGLLEGVLLRPRITEKATLASSAGAYVFEVRADATKGQVRDAVRHLYNVTPQRINMTKIPPKRIRSRAQRRVGMVSGGKKAYVYLKEGDTIEIV